MSAKEKIKLVEEIRRVEQNAKNYGFNYEGELYYANLLEKAKQNNICAW